MLIICIGIVTLGRLFSGYLNEPAPASPPLATARAQTGRTGTPFVTDEPALATPPRGETVAIVRVIDGDTVEVLLGGQATPVRYIGINTPERDEVCGDQATAANARLVEGQRVTLVVDVSERDRFDRLLRYVYVGDLFVNAVLVEQGYAEAVSYPPDTRHYEEFRALEHQAKAAGLGCHPTGVFGASGGAGEPLPT